MRSEIERGPAIELALVVNGEPRTLRVPPLRRLIDCLREDLALTGTKEGCGEGECGACTVLVDGQATLSCLVPVCQARGATITTIEAPGLASIQEAFLAEGGAQCGICTPGMITMTRAYLDRCERDGERPDYESARLALAGNLCRCTGYGKILQSVLSSARSMMASRATTTGSPATTTARAREERAP
jgi:carbon-monoxide dehydrogenase small subunit